MDIPGLSIAMSQSKLMTDVGVAVLDKALTQVETLGEGMVQMMEQSVTPNLGQSIDIRL